MTNNKGKRDQPEIYFEEDSFDYSKFLDVYNNDNTDLTAYRQKTAKNRDLRRNRWPGKTDDLKKSSATAFPHKGSSDTEVYTIDKAIQNHVAMCMNALRRSKIMAYPREASDVERSGEVSSFLRYMRDGGIKNFYREMELAASYGAEKGIMITYTGWEQKKRPVLKRYDLDKLIETLPELDPVIAQDAQEFIEMLSDEDRVDEILKIFNSVDGWEINEKRVKKALRQLRKDGVADIPFISSDGGSFDVQTKSPDSDVILPVFTMNPQDAPRIHMRMLMTGQDIQAAASSDEWDKEWADYMVLNHTGMSASKFQNPNHSTNWNVGAGRSTSPIYTSAGEARDFIEVVYTYERLIDKEDGAEGIYLTIWSPDSKGANEGIPDYAKRTLLSGRKTFPFVITPLTYEAKTLYDSQTFPELLKAAQKTKKVLRDGYIDEQEWSVSPMMWGGPGVDLSQVGPGARGNGPTNRKPEFIIKDSKFTPNINLDQVITDESSEHIGQNPENPLSQQRNQHEINKFLYHAQSVLASEYEVYKLEGPDELFFRVTGSRDGDATNFIKNEDEAEMDINISFNTMHDDPEWMKNAIEMVTTVKSNDSSGLIDGDKMNLWMMSGVDPMLGEMVTTSKEKGSEKMIKEVRADISEMASGFAVSPAKNAAQARLGIVDQYISEQQQVEAEGVATILGTSQQFQKYLLDYREVLSREVEQGQNAQIGRNQAPVMVGDMNVEGINGAT
jgi:hypothetical protein